MGAGLFSFLRSGTRSECGPLCSARLWAVQPLHTWGCTGEEPCSLSGPLLSHPCLTLVGCPGLSDPSPCRPIPLSSHLLFLLLLSISWAPYLLSLSTHPFIPQPCPGGWGGISSPFLAGQPESQTNQALVLTPGALDLSCSHHFPMSTPVLPDSPVPRIW